MPSMTADDRPSVDPGAPLLHRHGHRRPDLLAAAGRISRSDSPHAFAAGLARRPVSPPRTRWMSRMDWTARVGRVYELDGQVLLLGVDHTANTTIHLASI